MPGLTRERLERTLGVVRPASNMLKTALLFAALIAIAIAASHFDRNPNLSHVQVAFLSGSEHGNYYAIVSKLAAEAKRQSGNITNISTAGSIENIERLAAGRASCRTHFALVQDGLKWPDGNTFELIGRLGTPESLVVLGRDADRIRTVADLRGKRIGIGPVGSGTERVSRQVLAQLSELNLDIVTLPIDEQLAKLESGELDLGAIVTDKDAQLLVDAVRKRKLQIVDIAGADALANRLPFARAGKIEAGHYDPVRQVPPVDKRVIQIDTLVIGNGCAKESTTQGLITTLVHAFPDFVRVNRERANLTGLPLASAARSYYEEDGPDLVGEHVPWIIDIMPTARWLQLFFAVSVLFGGMAALHRFRLWRLDAARVRIEDDVSRLFGPGTTVGEIAAMKPEDGHRTPEARARLDAVMQDLGQLGERCRRQSLSMLVPMGHEMAYRYQEGLIADLLHALRKFRSQLDR